MRYKPPPYSVSLVIGTDFKEDLFLPASGSFGAASSVGGGGAASSVGGGLGEGGRGGHRHRPAVCASASAWAGAFVSILTFSAMFSPSALAGAFVS